MVGLILLLVAGLLVLGLPQVNVTSRRRFWHPWVENGLVPLLFGMLVASTLHDFVDDENVAFDITRLFERLKALLVVALAAAGLLVGIQLRLAYLQRSGGGFLARQSGMAFLVALGAAVCSAGVLRFAAGWDWMQAGIASALLGSLAMASSQRPFITCEGIAIRQRDIVTKHVAPSGWWNLLALLLAAVLCSIATDDSLLQASHDVLGSMVAVVSAILLGLALAWLAVRARNSSEAYLFLIAVLGLAGGIAALLALSPLLVGLLVGAVFANLASSRTSLVERALADLEQPVVIAVGFFTGVQLQLGLPALWVTVAVLLVWPLRYLLRGRLSPTAWALSTATERRLVPAGATGALLIGAVVLIEHESNGVDFSGLVLPMIAVCVVLSVVEEIETWRAVRGIP